ncbi:MobQ family relaxase [Enterococcus sp. BWR-S5]|uniref:MobQ family relaxase n=1 Tax=Enterococcus sp. BWR-S5 TaxID=2787714 RepID=UPI001920739C|nr:MobQ family relaxase [Enterococcus sp. BWR-S5]MBL1227224.1 MobA/MobL family protein [Enterococcus sp. BWR-S5]
MAIYHFSMKIISRGSGQNAVASAAYRSGEKLIDENTGETKFYKREVMPETMILAPDSSPSWVYDRQRLWNEVEKAEKRVNSQLSRELQIALPIELNEEQQRELMKDFLQSNCVGKGMIADVGIHRDHPENPHAHVMLTTREISADGFTTKNRDWNKKEYLNELREEWAKTCNKHLEMANSLERIDHRSFKERGIEALPTKHVGVAANAMESKGIKTEKQNRNNMIKQYNDKIISLEQKRQELVEKGAVETNVEKDRHSLVISYTMYMGNQRDIRVALNKINYYEKKEKDLKKQGKQLLDFEKSSLENAKNELKESTKNKFDYLKHVRDFLDGKNSIFYKFAQEFGDHEAKKIKEENSKQVNSRKLTDNDLQRISNRYRDEMIVRFSSKIKELNTTDFKTIISQVEKDLYFNKAKFIVKGWTNHETVTKKIAELREKLPALNNDQKIKVIKDISILEYTKQFYELQAVHALKSGGYHNLIDKYDSPKYQAVIVGLHEELIRQGDQKMTSLQLENRVINNFKIRKAQDLVRGDLTGTNLEKRLLSYDSWKGSLERQLKSFTDKNGVVDLTEAQKSKLSAIEENLKTVKQNIQLLNETKNILKVRANEFLKANPEIKDILKELQLSPKQRLSDPLSLDYKIEANYGLFNSAERYAPEDLKAKMFTNILELKEFEIERESKGVLRKSEYESYRAIVSNLDNYKRTIKESPTTIQEYEKKIEKHSSTLETLETKWKERDSIVKLPKIAQAPKAKQLAELENWFSERDLTAKSLMGTYKQARYLMNNDLYQYNQLKAAQEVKVPALENMKVIAEQKALATVERDFGLKLTFQYSIKLSEQEKETIIAYSELKKTLGADHLDVQKLERSIAANTEKWKEEERKETNLDSVLNQEIERRKATVAMIDRRIESLSNGSMTVPVAERQQKLNDLRDLRKTEMKDLESLINREQKKINEQRSHTQQAKSAVRVGNNMAKMLEGIKLKVSEAEKNQERMKRLKSIEKEKEVGLELTKKRKSE